jgi:hypothetical protein
MTTLEMVTLRSKHPFTGLVTLRHAVPTITKGAFDLADAGTAGAQTTTPKVATGSGENGPGPEGETAARKGGEAR